jgi:hypothetical protein
MLLRKRIWGTLILLLAFAFTGCGPGGSEPSGREPGAASASTPDPALIVWTCVDPFEPVFVALEGLVALHNERFPQSPATLRYVPMAEFPTKVAGLADEVLPPDLFLVPSPRLLELARQGVLQPLEGLPLDLEASFAGIYEEALNTLTENGRRWGVPICGSMTLSYTNRDRAQASFEENGTWEQFRAGQAAQCRASSDRLGDLVAAKPAFRWNASLEEKESVRSLETLALGWSNKGLRTRERVFRFLALSQEPAAIELFLRNGSKLPLRKEESFQAFIRRIGIEGAWLSDSEKVGRTEK